MVDSCDEVRQFISYLTPEDKKELLDTLADVLPQFNQFPTKPINQTKNFSFFKNYITCNQIIQLKNHRNDEIILRQVQESNLLQKYSYVEVFYNFEEISLSFVQQIYREIQKQLKNEQKSVYTIN